MVHWIAYPGWHDKSTRAKVLAGLSRNFCAGFTDLNPPFGVFCSKILLWFSWWRHLMETFSALLTLCAGIHRAPGNSPHKGQWRGALVFSSICAWINGWVNNREAGDLRHHRAHYDVIIMLVGYKLASTSHGDSDGLDPACTKIRKPYNPLRPKYSWLMITIGTKTRSKQHTQYAYFSRLPIISTNFVHRIRLTICNCTFSFWFIYVFNIIFLTIQDLIFIFSSFG